MPPIRISSPRHTYIVVANENPVAIMVKDWGTTYTPHVSLNLVEIGKFNTSMRRNSADSWSRPMIRDDQIPAVSISFLFILIIFKVLCLNMYFYIV